MAEFYTLEEAARVLGMSPDDLKSKAQEREVRGFLDGGSWQFRKSDVEELARRSGLGSDAELRLSDLEVPAAGGGDDFGDLDLSEFQIGVAPADLGAETMRFGAPKKAGDAEGSSEHDLMIDDLSVPPSAVTGSSSVIIGMSHLGKSPSDSDVRLVPEDFKGASDSDVRLAPPGRAPSDSDVTLVKDDTSELGVFSASASESSVGPSPVSDSSAEQSSAAVSDFELAPSSELVDALQPESGSDFELSALDSSSDEFEATPLKPGDSDVTAADPNLSGINLSRPSDSGINLLGAFGGGDSMELAPLSDPAVPTNQAAPEKPKPSLSATPRAAVGQEEKDIFDDTDFEVDAASLDDESDDKTLQLDAASDFDLDDGDSGSEVFAIDEEDVDTNAATAMAPADLGGLDDDDEEDDGFDDAVSAEIGNAWASDDTPSAVAATPGVVISREASADWDGLSVGLLAFASIFVLLSSFLAYDLVQNLYSFNDGGPASGLVQSISGMVFG